MLYILYMNKKKDTKRAKFLRLAISRTNFVLKKLNTLGHLSNRSAYSYTEQEVEKMFSEIDRKVQEVKARFHYPRKEHDFKL